MRSGCYEGPVRHNPAKVSVADLMRWVACIQILYSVWPLRLPVEAAKQIDPDYLQAEQDAVNPEELLFHACWHCEHWLLRYRDNESRKRCSSQH